MAIWIATAAFSAGALAGARGTPIPIAVGLILLAFRPMARDAAVAAASCALAFGCGALLAGLDREPAALATIARSVPRCSVEATILERAGSFGSLMVVDALRCPEESFSGDIGIAVVREIEDDPGSTVSGQGWLVPLTTAQSDLSAGRMGAVARIRFRDHEVGEPSGAVHRTTANLRAALVDATGDISQRAAGLLRGLTIGDTTQIDYPTVQAFRDSGLSHLVAVSGSNVAIVVGAAVFAARNSSLRMRTGMAAGCLILFVLVVGPEPSVLRAAAMGSLALVALLSGRATEPIAALGVATSIVIALRPEMVHSAGLHLSVAATAGIVLFGSGFSRRLGRLPRPVALVLGATLGAQVAVAPVVVGTFGEFSVVAPLSNLVAAPAVPPATVLGLGAALLHALWPPLGRATMALAEPFAAWILWVADVSAAIPYAAITVPRLAGVLVAVPVGWFAIRAARRRVG